MNRFANVCKIIQSDCIFNRNLGNLMRYCYFCISIITFAIFTMAQKQRIDYIDLAKGILIIMVVFYHADSCGIAGKYINYMFMPAFFLLAGLFFKDYGGMRNTMLRKADKLLVPMLFFTALYVVLGCVLYFGTHKSYLLGGVLYGSAHLRPIFAMWFLACLFSMNFLFFVIRESFKNSQFLQALAVVVLAGGGYALSVYSIKLPLYLDTALTNLPFFYIGYMLRKTPLLYPHRWDKFCIPAALVLIALGVVIRNMVVGTPAYIYNEYPNGILPVVYVVSLLLILGMLLLCKAIKRLPLVSYMGRYSIIILGVHQAILLLIGFGLDPIGLGDHKLLIAVVTTVVSALLIAPMKRYFPKFTAQENFLSRNVGNRSVEIGSAPSA